MFVVECRCVVKGFAEGEPLISDTPINFLTMIDTENGEIKDPNHNLYGKTLKGKIFVFPNSVGSSVGAYMLYSLKKKRLWSIGNYMFQQDGHNDGFWLCYIKYPCCLPER